MEKENKGKKLFGFFQGAVDKVKSTVQDVKLPEVRMPGIKIPENLNPAAIFQRGEKTKEGNAAATGTEITALPVRNILMIMYYMMAADGVILENEVDKFDEIGRELDPEYEKNRDQIFSDCKAQMDKAIDPEDYFEVLQDGVGDAILASAGAKDALITPKVLLWDMMAIAFSDGDYAEKERQLVKYAARKLNVDKAVFLEMESYFLTIMDLEHEMAWIKTTNRPYVTIEAMVNEIADRKNVIFESAKDLITL